MRYLKIEDNKGYYLKTFDQTESWVEIDKINKDDLLNMLNSAVTDDFQMDAYNEESLGNKAHQIIYKNLYEKLLTLSQMKDTFKDESESLYKEAIEKYSKQ